MCKVSVWGDLSKLKFKIRQFSVVRVNVEFHKQIGETAFGEVRKVWRYERLEFSGRSRDNTCILRYGDYTKQRIIVQIGQNDMHRGRRTDRQFIIFSTKQFHIPSPR